MSKERGRHQNPRTRNHVPATKGPPARVHLASGVRLGEAKQPETLVLVSPQGKVQLNEVAVTVLRLCDGSRTRDDIVAEVAHRALGSAIAADISEFLDVARSRGWTVET